MRIDVSEVKTLRECPRKWGYSSRNYHHLRSRVAAPNLKFGVIFHESLHSLYMEGPSALNKIVANAVSELAGDKTQQIVITSMLQGYTENVLIPDLDRYAILDIEHSFNFQIFPGLEAGDLWKEIEICGSIDMIAADHAEKKIYGFEHKSCAAFRPEYYNRMDEQPRLYYIALDKYVADYNKKHGVEYTNGGIYLNQVRKLQRKFDWHRGEPLTYSVKDCRRFMDSFMNSCALVHKLSKDAKEEGLPLPTPGYMKCQMCDFREICSMVGYEEPTLEFILDEFGEEVEVRDVDHLEEKTERSLDK